MKHPTYILLILILFSSCINHDRKSVRLHGFEKQKEIKYENGIAIFYIGNEDYIEYLKEKSIEQPPQNSYYGCIIDYIKNSEDNPIIISDSIRLLNTEVKTSQNVNDSILNNADIYPSDNLRWAIIDLVKKGRIKIFNKKKKEYVDNIIIDEIKSPSSGEVIIMFENKIEIFNQLRYAYTY